MFRLWMALGLALALAMPVAAQETRGITLFAHGGVWAPQSDFAYGQELGSAPVGGFSVTVWHRNYLGVRISALQAGISSVSSPIPAFGDQQPSHFVYGGDFLFGHSLGPVFGYIAPGSLVKYSNTDSETFKDVTVGLGAGIEYELGPAILSLEPRYLRSTFGNTNYVMNDLIVLAGVGYRLH